MSNIHPIINTGKPDLAGNVIFVHGLNGDWAKTWGIRISPASTVDINQPNLPVSLGQDFPNLGVWSIEYEVSSTAWNGATMPLTDRATNILKLLEVKQLAKHPIIFVTHSMGGLVVKQLLRNAIDSAMPEWRLIVEQTKGIVFLSTPHTGSDLASLMESFKWLYRPTISVMQLRS